MTASTHRRATPTMAVPADPGLPSELGRLARAGRLPTQTVAQIHRALICPTVLLPISRPHAVDAVAAADTSDPEVAQVLASALLELCPSFAPSLLDLVCRYHTALATVDASTSRDHLDRAMRTWALAVVVMTRNPADIVDGACQHALICHAEGLVLADALRHPADREAQRMALKVLAENAEQWMDDPEGACEVDALRFAFAPMCTWARWAEIRDEVRAVADETASVYERDAARNNLDLALDIAVGTRDEHGRRVTR